ncbi:hypothetical protein [Chryseobacterium sp.]|uniref:hypothetical protein n=1 Tax=Chryseobacterium sp. TaxID=1871047 RepID=UPI00289C6808|nr:hypothetical protein [Chryseobacterium sp.]
MKDKKIYLLLFVCIIICSGFIASWLGYKLPEWDKHRDWIFIPENEDAVFEIEKTNTKLGGIYTIPNHRGLLSMINDGDFLLVTIITEKGKTIKKFPKTKDFYIDSLNQRFIISNEIYKSDTLFKKQLISYRFSDYKKQENLELKDYIIEETQAEFAKRKNYPKIEGLGYEQTEKAEKDLDDVYLNEKTKEVSFYKTLYPVTKISTLRDVDTEFYTNKYGALYTVEKTKIKTGNIIDITQSLYTLFPNYNKKMNPELFELKIRNHPTYEEVEKPTIESNFFYTANLSFYFKQNEIEYYRIRFGNKYFNFKYKNKTGNFPTQLSIPKSENDTLTCEINDTLYWIYPKANKIKK